MDMGVRVRKRRITFRGILRLLDDEVSLFLPLTKKGVIRNFYNPKLLSLEEYFPSEVVDKVNRLQRSGLVTKEETPEGIKVTITDKGKKQKLYYKLDELGPKKEKWDGKWRLVMFDIGEMAKHKRDVLRRYLDKIGMKMLQESVFISPFDITGEVKYLREVLEVPDVVKIMVVSEAENSEELRAAFEV